MRKLTEHKVLLETLSAITSDFLMAKFVEVAEVEGFEFKVPHYGKYYMLEKIDKENVPYIELIRKKINHLRVRLWCDEGIVFVYELKDEPFIYLVEILPRGCEDKAVYLNLIKLHYYVGEEEPDREEMGYIRVGSDSIIGFMTDFHASDLVDVLARFKNWRVSL
jgi:hypothetical protein